MVKKKQTRLQLLRERIEVFQAKKKRDEAQVNKDVDPDDWVSKEPQGR